MNSKITVFLTSSHTIGWAGPLNPANGFATYLRAALKPPIRCAMVSSFPDDVEITDRMAWEIRECFQRANMGFVTFEVIDRRTAQYAQRIIADANFIILCGGHVPTENSFFHDIHLRQLLENFSGVVMGVSAGSMNCAETVYASPERDGESSDPNYQLYLQGLGLTDINILPHFQQLKRTRLDGKRLVRDIVAAHSFNGPIFCIPDGSFFMIKDGATLLCGEAYRMRDGHLKKICDNNQRRRIYPSGRIFKL